MSTVPPSEETPFDAQAAWEILRRLAPKIKAEEDPAIYDAFLKQLTVTVEELKRHQSPIPPDILADPLLRTQFVPDLPKSGAEIPAGELLFGLPVNPKKDGPVPASMPEDEWQPIPVTPEQIAEAENILRQAKVFQMRGSKDEALNLLKQAETIAPGASIVLEAIGDELAAQRKTIEARKYYDRARRADPKNVSADKKFADLIFRTDVAPRTYDIAESEVVANAKSAVILSAILPGVGQIVTGQLAKGVVFMVAILGCWILAFALGLGPFMRSILGQQQAYNSMAPMIAGVAVVLYFINVIDISMKAKGTDRRVSNRPRPPENLPFE